MKKLIKNGIVISMDKNRKEFEKLDIVIENDRIIELCENYNGEYDKLIDATDKVVMPGLINAHTHLGMSIFRATNDNLCLQDWLEKKIWPIEAKMTDEEVYYASLLSCVEMIKTGTTCLNDMYFGWRGTMKALLESKIRAVMSRCLIGEDDSEGNRMINEFETMISEYKNTPNITFAVAPHGLYTCSKEYLKKCTNLSIKYDIPIHVHFCENKDEVKTIENNYQKSPINALKEIGFLNRKLILAHVTFLSEEDQKLVGSNVSFVTNPISNLNLGCGIADLVSYQKHNINIALGTDGQGSGNNMNLFKHMSLVSDLQKAKYEDPTIMSAYDVLKMATINGAQALDLDKEIGSIEIGKKADIIILDLNNIETYPYPNLLCEIVHNVESSNVDTTIINGNILMENHELKINIDEKELKSKIKNICTELKIN